MTRWVTVQDSIADPLIAKLGRKIRMVSEKDFQLMLGFMEGIGIKRKVKSQRVVIRGGETRRVKNP